MGNEIEEIRNMIQQALARLDALEAPAEEEWPKVGDEYWVGCFIDRVRPLNFDRDSADKYYKYIGDMHRTKEEAEAYRAYRMNPRTVMRDRIQMFLDAYNGDWVWRHGEWYWFISGEDVCRFSSSFSAFALKDEKGAELLLEKFGIENILWACGGPAPGGE